MKAANGTIVAVAHSILITIYVMLRDGITYDDLGNNYFDEGDREGAIYRSVHRIERLGFKVTLEVA